MWFIKIELNLKAERKMHTKSLKYETAARHVFDVDRLEKSKAKNSDIWCFPHLLAYKELTRGESKIREKANIDSMLTQVANELSIEYIHVHGDETHFFTNSKKRTYFTVQPPEPSPSDVMVERSRKLTPVRSQSCQSLSINLGQTTPVIPGFLHPPLLIVSSPLSLKEKQQREVLYTSEDELE